MATPHVAGLVAYFLAGVGKGEGPAKMKERVVKAAEAKGGRVGTGEAKGYVEGGALVVVSNESEQGQVRRKGGLLGL